MSEHYLLEMKHITKQFPGVLALNKVDLELHAGEVLALLGENGAGKSTLIKILSGAYSPDEGEIWIDQERQDYKTPKEANEKGVSIIYQELNYLDYLTVAENIFLNRYIKTKRGSVDWKKMNIEALKILEMLEVDILPTKLMHELSVAEKQLVEIAKALSHKAKLLIMDEPTSALSEKEALHLMNLVRRLKEAGTGIIFISHRLDELFDIADRIMVMRDGERVGVTKISEATREDLIALMVGRKVETFFPKRKIAKKETVLEVKHISTNFLQDISLSVRKSEILGIFGLMGAGRSELARCITGIQKMNDGEIFVEGEKISVKKPADTIKRGISYVTAERKKDGLILNQSVKENIMTAALDQNSSPFKINRKKEKAISDEWKEKLSIKTPSIDTTVNDLSGGNQQKVVLAKWLATKPKVLILNEPTRGIDVGAKSEIYNLMEDFCEEGLGVIMISSELPEILQLSDRVIVMCEGKVTAEFSQEEMTQEKLMQGAVGEV